MKRYLLPIFFLILCGALFFKVLNKQPQISGAPPYGEPETAAPENAPFSWIQNWMRPDGPAKVGLQVGHWKNEELPEELDRLIGNTGSSGGGKTEVQVNLEIAEKVAAILRTKGVTVDILPATVPKGYVADAFIAIHADGSTDRNVSGFKIASPWRDYTGKAQTLRLLLTKEYGEATKLAEDPNITRNMRGYYAFAWWRYEHAIHPMTPAVIVETGFLTNASDRKIIVSNQELPATSLATGIETFLRLQGVLE